MRTLVALMCCGVIGFSACSGEDKAAGGKSGASSSHAIKGVVQDPAGQPIAGADVAAGDTRVTTDASGGYVLGYDKRKPKKLVVSKGGYTQTEATFVVDEMKPVELIPAPAADGVYLIGDKGLELLAVVTLTKSGAMYSLKDVTYLKLPKGKALRFALKGVKASHVREVPMGDPISFGPGMTLNPVAKTHAITGGGELTVQTYGPPTNMPDARWALANFLPPNHTPEGDRAVLFQVE